MLMAVFNGVTYGPEDLGSKRARARFGLSGLLVASLGMLCVTGGCGVMEESTRLDTVFDRTGTLQSDGVYAPMATTDDVRIGDSSLNVEARGFVSISLNALPTTATVTKALLQFKGIASAGNPFGDFVTLRVDHVNVVSGISADDYVASPIEAIFAEINSLPANQKQDVSIDVTKQVNADRAAGRPISSFRFRFRQAPTIDGQADAAFIDASDDDGGSRPSILVTFRR